MFEGQEQNGANPHPPKTKIPPHYQPATYRQAQGWFKDLNVWMIFLAVFLSALIGLFLFIFFFRPHWLFPPSPPIRQPLEEATSTSGHLGGHIGGDLNGDSTVSNGTSTKIQAENLAFGSFYQSSSLPAAVKIKPLTLPLDAKINLANYYESARQLNLDPYLDELNNKGFVVVDNPFRSEGNDFFSIFNSLSKRQLPFFLTADFLTYYYYTHWQGIFRSVEEDVFFDYIWNISRQFYQNADQRYRARLSAVGEVNDPLLEAERREAAFFAVTLELLKPARDQVAPAGTNRPDKFTDAEAARYDFALPIYLAADVPKEKENILAGQGVKKSPVMLYDQNYAVFVVPPAYQRTARLRNYYMAAKWFNVLYPLNYRSETCPDCALDQSDWLISFISACLIAEDFQNDQSLKNDWAKIYKVVSFFSGLRRDLTYLHYIDALKLNFGEDYEVEKVFSGPRTDVFKRAEKTAGALREYKFLTMEGAIDRDDPKQVKNIGMRLLQERYWPNDYILKQLVYPAVGEFQPPAEDPAAARHLKTACTILVNQKKDFYRCRGFGLDVINLIYPLPEHPALVANTYFANYPSQAGRLTAELGLFDRFSWHSNIYWQTLHIGQKYLQADYPLLAGSDIWREKKIRTVLSSWTALQLPADTLSRRVQEASSLAGIREGDLSLIEPEPALVAEFLADTKMLHEMLMALAVIQDADTISRKFRELIGELEVMAGIINKETAGQALDPADKKFISEFATSYTVSPAKEKIFTYYYPSGQSLVMAIEGVDLLLTVYETEGKKYLVFGPLFKFSEN